VDILLDNPLLLKIFLTFQEQIIFFPKQDLELFSSLLLKSTP